MSQEHGEAPTPERRDRIRDLLRQHLAAEAGSDFERLKRIPQTGIIQFLDYYDDLTDSERTALLDALAEQATTYLLREYDRARAQFDKVEPLSALRQAKTEGDYCWALRYTPIKHLRMIASDKESGGIEAWMRNAPAGSRVMRADLMPSGLDFVTSKAAATRKAIEGELRTQFGARKEKRRFGTIAYECGHEGNALSISLDTGSMMSQLRYGVSVLTPRPGLKFVQVNYEALWGDGTGWDCLTEENLPRAATLFPEQIVEMSRLATRVNAVLEE
jgi:hypothetical protein